MKANIERLRQLGRYPTAVIGLVMITLLVIISIVTPFIIPYNEAIRLWRGGEDIWGRYPRNAAPAWRNWFTSNDVSNTIILDSADGDGNVTIEQLSADTREARYSFEFDFPYDTFPPEVSVFANATYDAKQPFVEMTWITPDGREIRAGELTASANTSFRFNQDDRLQRRLERETGIDGVSVVEGLFDDPAQEGLQVLQGTYRLDATALLFEADSALDIAFVSYGEVHGVAGTDHQRRDLSVALLWGTPIAMAFGLLAALATTVITMIIAAVGVWYGGWLDAGIQRVTEVNSIIPLLPILIMVGTLYSRSIWIMLGLVIPAIVTLVPGFVFLEASLAVLGLGDPVLPTWGKLINDAATQGALFNGYYYWILQPSVLLMIAGLAFAMVGFALDRVFNPRLREV